MDGALSAFLFSDFAEETKVDEKIDNTLRGTIDERT
jgi:hypothetical protein